MFNFGAKPAAPASAPATGVPSLSFTSATPAASVGTSSPFSFGNASTANNSQPAASGAAGTGGGGLFGGTNNQQSGQQQQQQPTGSLFGGAQQQQQAGATTTGGGLFGNLGGNNAQQSAAGTTASGTGGGMFGGGGLFGNKSTTTPAAGTTGTGGSSLFGGGGSSLFGGQQQQQQPQQPQQGQTSLFGQTNQQQQQPGQSTSLFGSQQQPQQQQQQSSIFAGQSTSTQSTLFGGQQQQQQQPSSQGVTGSTKFTDLPESVQKEIERMDAAFKQFREQGASVNPEPTGRVIQQMSLDIKAASDEYAALNQTFITLAKAIEAHDKKETASENDLKQLVDFIDAYIAAESRTSGGRPIVQQKFPVQIYVRAAHEMQDRVGRYKTTISQLQRAINSLASNSEKPSPEAIGQTIQNHQNAIITLAGQLERLNIRLDALRASFTATYQDIVNTARDPFEVARQNEKRPPRIRI